MAAETLFDDVDSNCDGDPNLGCGLTGTTSHPRIDTKYLLLEPTCQSSDLVVMGRWCLQNYEYHAYFVVLNVGAEAWDSPVQLNGIQVAAGLAPGEFSSALSIDEEFGEVDTSAGNDCSSANNRLEIPRPPNPIRLL